jgi:hypothetical protein
MGVKVEWIVLRANPLIMKLRFNKLTYLLALVSALILTSCYTEDPGALQEVEKQFSSVDFDRLEMGDAFHVTVKQGSLYSITATGDRRNIDDLVVKEEGTTLVIRYNSGRNRKHSTNIEITMPSLSGATFSGATDSRIYGFDDLGNIVVRLSGASTCQLDASADKLDAVISGASYLYLNGEGSVLKADLSGASVLKAFNYPVTTATVIASGASDGHLTVTSELDAVASGASVITYRGNPQVDSQVSGSSTVRQD